MGTLRLVAALGISLGLLGCNSIFGLSDLRYDGAGGGSGGSGAAAGAPAVGGMGAGGMASGGMATGGMGGVGGAGAGGGEVGFVDRGLVARYWIDELANGNPSDQIPLADAAPDPVPLTIEDGSELLYTQLPTGRGLRWPSDEDPGRAVASIGGTKLGSAFQGMSEGTIEVVVALEGTTNYMAQIFHVAPQSEGSTRFGMRVEGETGRVAADFNDTSGQVDHNGLWDPALVGEGRVVLHLIVDTSATDESARLRLYRDGQPMTFTTEGPVVVEPPSLGETLALGPSPVLVVGNRTDATRGLWGTIFYLAFYDVAFTEAEIAINGEALANEDDP